MSEPPKRLNQAPDFWGLSNHPNGQGMCICTSIKYVYLYLNKVMELISGVLCVDDIAPHCVAPEAFRYMRRHLQQAGHSCIPVI